MASNAGAQSAGRPQRGYIADQGFFVRYALFLAIFILFGFAQFAVRGIADPLSAPLLVHVHGVLMVSWLAIFVAQNLLVHRGQLDLHRALGWTSIVLMPVVVVVGIAIAIQSIQLGRVPPFFSNAFLLALTGVSALTFGALVAWAVLVRRNIQWHRRAMLGSIFALTEPALGRLLPLPLMNGWGQWASLVFQLVFVAILALHDRKTLGSVHPATRIVAIALVVSHALFEWLAVFPPFIALADGIAAG